MNKADLIKAVAQASNLTLKDAESAVSGLFDAITHALRLGQDVRLVGFGTFSVTQTKARQGRNPRTGAPLTIPASRQPRFRAGKELKDKVNA